jgi:hypothetical protein
VKANENQETKCTRVMHEMNADKSTYNSFRDGNDASETGMSPVMLLFCKFLHM